MRKIFIIIFALATVAAEAQPLNNSWIDYGKTYYKFKVTKPGLYRINQSLLVSLGLNNTPAEYFQLWRNGEQVRLYTSVATGPFSANDYIEFWGKANDGLPDKNLYLRPGYQLCDSFSLHSDTAAYFLTVNPFAGNLRYTNTANDVAFNTLPQENYFMRTVAKAFRQQYNRGYAVQVGEMVYSSSYDISEGWTTYDIGAGDRFAMYHEFSGMNVYQAGPANSVSYTIAAGGNALNTRKIKVKFFNNLVDSVAVNYFDTLKRTIANLPLSLLQSPTNLQVSVTNNSLNPFDRIVVANIAVTYPATFNFNGQKNFYFELKPSSQGNYLVIDNFDNGASVPVLYCLTDGKRYAGDLNVAGKVRFVLPASLDPVRKFMLVSEEAANVTSVTSATPRTFINFNEGAHQGDYLIISNQVLFNDGAGNNYVEQYRQYRSSERGGAFNAKVMDIEELYDQFSFGIPQHPAAIRDFVRFASRQYTPSPQYVLIIGRGVTSLEYKQNETNPDMKKIEMVPTFGWPASDVLLACEPGMNVPLVPIGRISAVNGTEIKNYLNKVKEYEQVQSTISCSILDKEWMKRVIHVVGGADAQEDNDFTNYLNSYASIIEDTAYGAYVETFRKTSSAAVEQANGERIQQLINQGVGFIGYFGHSSANTLAFNLTSPDIFNNEGKYPFFNISGCSAGNFFTFDPLRATGGLSVSEKYVLADRRGSIGFLGSTHLGIPPFLNFYNLQLYTAISKTMYGSSIGQQIQRVLQNLGNNPMALDFYTRIHLEEINLHGDPAIKLNHFTKPDYAIQESSVKLNPSIITVADNSFTVKVKFNNLGRVIGDSIRVTINRHLPNDSVQVIYDQLRKSPGYADSLEFTVPINPITDRGLNKIVVAVEADNIIDETCETNNNVNREFYILEDEVRPVSPYNYSIVNQSAVVYTASTANPLMSNRQYRMQVDTTELFNSPFLKEYTTSGAGGVLQFTPTNITYTDSTVYYWRTSMVPLNTSEPVWNSFSFIYLPNSSTGFNQSHYYQHKKSNYSNTIALNNDGVFRYTEINRNLQIKTGLYPYTNYDRITLVLDFDQLEIFGCKYGTLQFYVYDSITYEPWTNYDVTPGTGRFGSWSPMCDGVPRKFFEFPYGDPVYRKRAMDFIDSIPDGMYVSITNLGWTFNNSFINQWKADTLALGQGNSLYHKLKNIGFSQIDSFNRNLPFVYFFRKNNSTYTPKQFMGALASDQIEANIPVASKYKSGTIESPSFGPARSWTSLHWRGSSVDALPGDTSTIQVYGVTNNGAQTLMASVSPATDTSLAFIDAAVYPFVKLKMQNNDSRFATPYQLRYWRINADYMPEGAVAPNILFSMKDSVEQGEIINFSLAFKNISPVAFDSLKIRFRITDRNNVPHDIDFPRTKPLVSNDTVSIRYSIDTRNYPGKNTLFVMVNPDNDQLEQYYYNNFIYKDFYVKPDLTSPLLDVTFDGVHILNRDIVSAKPHILVKLKDENRFIALKDTSLLKVYVRYPDADGNPSQELTRIYFGDALQFTPADISGGENAATIDFRPHFAIDGEYELVVSDGRDEVGNKAGNISYKVTFTVNNKPMISNLLNYPNPFTTSTAFVFTITGSEVPQNIRIQIMTITGKIVREITKAELGNLHIGNNITEFKWDGTDMYGSKLANGVYLYRVITNMNGKSLDKYKADGDNTDKFFKGGYGKMYLMR
jgi:hypothetical protein